LKGADSVKITGSGDPFGSNHFRNIIKRINRSEYPRLKIDLHTNGQLFDERAWVDLGMAGLVADTQISIDAASSETYRIVRRGGDFDRLVRNLKFIRKLRQDGEITSLSMSFVVQALNFREMPDFVSLAREHGADCVSFAAMRNWGTFSEQEFERESVCNPRHPEHAEFLGILQNPIFRMPYVLFGGAMSEFLPAV